MSTRSPHGGRPEAAGRCRRGTIRLAAAAVLAALLLPASANADVPIYGVQEFTLRWMPVEGNLVAYAVYLSRNDGPYQIYSYVIGGNEVTIPVADHDLIRVQVAGLFRVGLTFGLGPLSDPSEAYRASYHPSIVTRDLPPTKHDYNRDGRGDLLFESATDGSLTVWQMNGLGIEVEYPLVDSLGGVHVAALGDFNGDAIADIIWRHQATGQLLLYLVSAGVGGLDPGWDTQIAATGDFDGDGKSDLVIWKLGQPFLETWLLNGANVYDRVPWSVPSTQWRVVGAADFDGDGADDIVFREPGGDITVGFSRLGYPTGFPELGDMHLDWSIAALGDLDGDHRDDIIWKNDLDGRMFVWLVDDDAIVKAADLGKPGPSWTLEGVRDLDGDGAYDLIWRRDDGQFRAWLMRGTSVVDQADLGLPRPDDHLAKSR